MNKDEMPRLPEGNLWSPERRIQDLKPGERVSVTSSAVHVDEDRRVWVDREGILLGRTALARLSVLVEATENGLVMWLHKRDTFKPEKVNSRNNWIPVIELREAEEDD